MAFTYHNHHLSIKSGETFKKISDLAAELAEPFYVYDLDGILERLELLKSSFQHETSIHYAMKANDHPIILKTLAGLGVGADVVSKGEMQRALEAGIPSEKIVFSGVGKTVNEIRFAVENQIKQINVESPQELKRIGEVAKDMGLKTKVAWRMNPDVNPETHPYIKTGFRENKFGMDESFVNELLEVHKEYDSQLELIGLTIHIGSQIRNLSPMLEAIEKCLPRFRKLKEMGFPMKTFDVGGGVGMNYESDDPQEEEALLKDYGKKVSDLLKEEVDEILCEPGRILVGRFGMLLGEVQYVKKTPYKKFVILNTGMHHLLRPSLYQAFHRILPMVNKVDTQEKLYDVVGPICESTDVLGYERMLPEVDQGDWLAVADTGAYGAVMASGYNAHDKPRELVVFKGEVQEVKR